MMRAAKVAPRPDDVEMFDCDQRSEEWRLLRLGIPTVSAFSSVMAQGEGKVRQKLLYRLAGELLSGEPAETYRNAYMDRGIEMEEEAREHYEFTRGASLQQVGFVRRTIHRPIAGPLVIGCSPDSLVGPDGVLEIKTMMPELLIAVADRGAPPPEHQPQCQGSLWVTGRAWCDLKFYYRKMPVSPTFRIVRNDGYIREISEAVERFDYDLQQLVKRIRAMGA